MMDSAFSWIVSAWLCLTLLGFGLLGYLYWQVHGDSLHHQAPSELRPADLFACLLSGGLALFFRDNFIQLESGLSPRRAARILKERWSIHDAQSHADALQCGVSWLGYSFKSEQRAYHAWQSRSGRLPIPTYTALTNMAKLISEKPRGPNSQGEVPALDMSAYDIQALTYIVRLGLRCEYISHPQASVALSELATYARQHYKGWLDFSVSALIGRSMRESMDDASAPYWIRHRRAHKAFLRNTSLLRHASGWTPTTDQATNPRRWTVTTPMQGPSAAGVPSSSWGVAK